MTITAAKLTLGWLAVVAFAGYGILGLFDGGNRASAVGALAIAVGNYCFLILLG